jgi:hypothetical protein
MSEEFWEAEEGEAGEAVKSTIDSIMDEQGGLRRANLTHMQMYRNLAVAGIGPLGSSAQRTASPLALNVGRNMCDAVTAKLTKLRPRPWCQTFGADPESKHRAKLIEQWISGGIYEDKLHARGPRVFGDCTIFGDGYFKTVGVTHEKTERVLTERVFPPEVVVDFVEGMHGDPRNIYQRKFIDKHRLAKMFPEKREEILELEHPGENDEEEINALFNARRQSVVRFEEAYHLATEEGADDGLLVQCVGGIELRRSVWKHSWHPFSKIPWSEGPLGWHGLGLMESLKGIQAEINRLLRKIQESMHLLGTPYVLVDRGASVAKTTITDIPGSILLYSGKEPKVIAPATSNPEVFSHLDRLYQRAYEISRISQLTANAKPMPTQSGRAQLVHQDIESDGFSVVTRAYEDLFMDVAAKRIRCARDMKRYTVRVFGDQGAERINFFRDIGLAEDEFMFRIFSSSFLGDSPAGQIDMAERLIQSRIMQNPDDILEQMDHPDMAAFVRRKLGPRKLVERMVSSMLRDGPQEAPDPAMNLALAVDTAQLMYIEGLQAMRRPDGSVSPENNARLGKVRNFILSCKAQLESAQAGMQAGGAAA